jgi:hypothetical protein
LTCVAAASVKSSSNFNDRLSCSRVSLDDPVSTDGLGKAEFGARLARGSNEHIGWIEHPRTELGTSWWPILAKVPTVPLTIPLPRPMTIAAHTGTNEKPADRIGRA